MILMDEEIKKQIMDRFYSDSRIDSSSIQVSVNNGAVTLSGTAPSILSRRAAYHVAGTVPGVVSVDDQIQVAPPPEPSPEGDQIQTRAQKILEWNADLDGVHIEVTLSGGRVILEGTVDSYWKKAHAEKLASTVKGVTGVTNELSVVPTKSVIDENLARQITEALDRNVAVEPGSVEVTVENGVVTLSGAIESWVAKNAAFFTAVYTDGVTHVNDNITLKRR